MTRYYIDYSSPYVTDYVYHTPTITSSFSYQNVNKDMDLRKTVTREFYKKLLKKLDGDI